MKKILIFNFLQKFNILTKIFLQFLKGTKIILVFVKIKNIKKLKKAFHNHKMKSKNLTGKNLKIIYKISKLREIFQNLIKSTLYKHRVHFHNLLFLKEKLRF